MAHIFTKTVRQRPSTTLIMTDQHRQIMTVLLQKHIRHRLNMVVSDPKITPLLDIPITPLAGKGVPAGAENTASHEFDARGSRPASRSARTGGKQRISSTTRGDQSGHRVHHLSLVLDDPATDELTIVNAGHPSPVSSLMGALELARCHAQGSSRDATGHHGSCPPSMPGRCGFSPGRAWCCSPTE